jgi:hypothetical protein
MTKNVFVVGLNAMNAERLTRLRGVEDVVFHPLLTSEAVSDTQEFDIPAMLREAEETLDSFEGTIDAIVGYIDFPVSTMLPLLCAKYGTRNASLESLLKCEHKYWSRKVMAEVVPDHTPTFTAFDPFDDNALSKIGEADLRFPFFVKPIKSSGSRLGFRIDSPEDFDYAIAAFRAEIGQISEPFNYVLDQANLPDDIKAIEGHYCMAERVIGGRQCTVEGYVHDGDVVPYGTVDSIRYPQVLSFFYYLYPSTLPRRVQDEMNEITRRVMAHIGYDNAGFNIEYYWDEVQNKIWLLEINTRIAQSHCDLFEMVDGVSHQQVTVDLGLGRKPDMGADVRQSGFLQRRGPRARTLACRVGGGLRAGRGYAHRLLCQAGDAALGTARTGRLQLRRGVGLDGGQQAIQAVVELRAGDEEAELRVQRHRGIGQDPYWTLSGGGAIRW